MLGFEVVKRTFAPIWVPVLQGQTVYVGQVVTAGLTAAGFGVKALGQASGAGGVTSDVTPFGVVIATNNKTETYNSTYYTHSTTGVQSQANQVARITSPGFVGAEGMFSKGDPIPMAQVDVIDPTTIIRGRLFNAAYGTAISTYANTTQSTTGALVVTSALPQTPLAYNKIIYGVDNGNAGIYRGSGNDTSTTNHVPDTYFPYDVEIGDKFKFAYLNLGTCKAQFDSVSMCIDATPDLSSNYWWLDVLEVNLKPDGQEYAIFRFNNVCFDGTR